MDSTAGRRNYIPSLKIFTFVLSLSTVVNFHLVQAGPRTAVPKSAEGEPLVFRLATDVVPSGGVQLANGVVVLPSDWSTIIVTKIPQSNSRVATCSATLVGPNVVLMAAHCVDAAFVAKVPRKAVLELDGGRLELACEIDPEYLKRDPAEFSPRGSEDYALCLMNTGKKLPPSLSALNFEVVDVTGRLAPGAKVLMTGYGCSEIKVIAGELVPTRSDTTLRIGDGKIETATASVAEWPAYVTIRSVNGMGAALCPGDSGGPLMSGPTTILQNAKRRVRGVNSSVDRARRPDGQYDIISNIAATGTPQFRDWSRDWLSRNAQHKPIICGVNRRPGVRPCRD